MTPVNRNAINKKWLLQDARRNAWKREIGPATKSVQILESEQAKRAGSRAERQEELGWK
jgi:hypothetical protein